MQTKLLLGPIGALLLGACSLVGKDAADLAGERTSPPPAAPQPAERAAGADVALQFPILFDYRQVLAAQDVSGLREGTHTFELDLYAANEVGWTPEAERLVRNGIRVVHVDDQKPAAVRVTLGPADATGARRARVDMDLTEAGSWIVMLGDGLVAAHADPELLAHYAVRDAATLRPRGDYEFLHPGLMLRTVGHCNHVHKVITKADETGVLRTVELHFSEPLERGAIAGALSVGFTDSEGRRRGGARAEPVSVRDRVVELRVPVLRDETGTLEIPLARIHHFAGRFRGELSCGEADGSMGVGYVFGGQASGEHIVAPLTQAASRALGEEPKSP